MLSKLQASAATSISREASSQRRKVKVNGVCEHHDFGCLGSAFYKEAMKRKLLKLREMGVNAVRTSHNMPAPELMELTDEMGFLVFSEAFVWFKFHHLKSKTLYLLFQKLRLACFIPGKKTCL